MKTHDNGSCYSVSISGNDIEAFADNWPCSGLRSIGRIWAQFDRSGDLVDLIPSNLEERGVDGSALLALIADGQEYAKEKLGLNRIPSGETGPFAISTL